MCARPAYSAGVRFSNSAGSPEGKENSCRTCRPRKPSGFSRPSSRRDQGAAVAAVHAVAVVAEATHQGVEHDRDLRQRPAGLVDRRAETEAGHRGDDDREGVLGAATVRDRVDERADHVEEVDERAGVGVDQQQRRRVGLLGRDVDEVDGLAVDLGQVVRELVHARLLRAPVEGRRPVVDRVAEVGLGTPYTQSSPGAGWGSRVRARRAMRSSTSAWAMSTVKGRMLSGVLC